MADIQEASVNTMREHTKMNHMRTDIYNSR